VIVVDASALLEVLLQTPAAGPIADCIFAPEESLHAPHLIDVEVAQILRRYHGSGEIDEKRGREALLDLTDLDLERYPHTALLPRVWELRQNLTAYDAAYLALAEALQARLITCDRRFARAVISGLTTAQVDRFPSSARPSAS
jgi:predicted nucleic acid-binding protein